MKQLILLSTSLFILGCTTVRSTEIVEYRQVQVAPAVETISVYDDDYLDPVDVTVDEVLVD